MGIPKLTPSEITSLWNSYLTNTMTLCVTRHFIATTLDDELRTILKYAEEISFNEIEKSKSFFEEANHPLPQKFDTADVDVNSPALFTDNLVLMIKITLCQVAFNVYGVSLGTSTRRDIRLFYDDSLKNTSQLFNRLTDLMIKKGLHHPEIHIPTPAQIEKISKQNFIAGWFTDRRPLVSSEVAQIANNIRSIEVYKQVMRGFAQVTPSAELKNHFQRGVDKNQMQIDVLQSILLENDLPQLPSWESEVTDSKISPFSDKLLLFKVTLLSSATAGQYGANLASVFRKDLGAHYTRLIGEELLYGEDSVDLLIKHQFLDQLPLAKERS